MSSILLRRSAALAVYRGRVGSTLFAPISNFLASPVVVDGGVIPAAEFGHFSSIGATERPLGFGFQSKGFHAASGPLNFKASLVSQTGFALEEYDDASSSRSGDEGLEIGKLGIAPEIVSALAKKGITKLFPIQVPCFLFLTFFFFWLLLLDEIRHANSREEEVSTNSITSSDNFFFFFSFLIHSL